MHLASRHLRCRPVRRARPASTQPNVEPLESRNLLSAPAVIDVIGHLPAAEYSQYIRDAKFFRDGSTFKDWGNEPTVAVNPVNRDQIAITSFAYGSAIQSPPGDNRASVWYSTDGGATWGIRFPFTEFPAPDARVPNDQTIGYDDQGVLHGTFLTGGSNALNVFEGSTANPNKDGVHDPQSLWQWNSNPVNLPPETDHLSDQPWMALQGSRVYVGYDFFKSDFLHAEERVSVSSDGGRTFTADNPISSGGQVRLAANPGLRLATDRAGNVYSIFGLADPPFAPDSGKPNQLHYRLNMSSDGGQTWKFTDVGGKPGGLVVDDGWSLQFGSLFGGVNRLRGNVTTVAADPTGAHVYAVYGKEDDAGVDRIYLAEFHPDPSHPGQLVERPGPAALSVPGQRSALPSVAVTDSGAVGVMYDTFNPADGQFHVHLAVSTNQGLTFADQDIYDFNPTGIAYPGDRLLGDYQSLVAVGKKLYGSFGGRGNTTDAANGIDTTDKLVPFFFSVNVSGTTGADLLVAASGPQAPVTSVSIGQSATAPPTNSAAGGFGAAGAWQPTAFGNEVAQWATPLAATGAQARAATDRLALAVAPLGPAPEVALATVPSAVPSPALADAPGRYSLRPGARPGTEEVDRLFAAPCEEGQEGLWLAGGGAPG